MAWYGNEGTNCSIYSFQYDHLENFTGRVEYKPTFPKTLLEKLIKKEMGVVLKKDTEDYKLKRSNESIWLRQNLGCHNLKLKIYDSFTYGKNIDKSKCNNFQTFSDYKSKLVKGVFV